MYGVKVPFDGVYIWVSSSITEQFELKPIAFQSAEEAADYADTLWKSYKVERLPDEFADTA